MKNTKTLFPFSLMLIFVLNIFGQHRGANIQDKNFSNRTIKYGDFYGATANRAIFNHAIVKNASFHGAQLRSVQFKKTDISRSTFYGADLKFSRMEGAVADEANFEGADMHKGQFNNSFFRCARFYRTSLNTAKCRNCDFSGANLDRADLRGADLSGSNFTKANITSNTLIDSNTKGLPPKSMWSKGYKDGIACGDLLLNYSNESSSTVNRRMTKFDPAIHGFNFSNRGFKPYLGDGGSISVDFSGFCGGMTYAAGDYFYKKIPRPDQDYQPAAGTTLYNYIYSRQSKSIENISGQIAEFTINPFGSRNNEFWGWAVNEKLRQLVNSIDAGRPTPILMLRVGKAPADNHWVMAIGYDLGGYKWKKENDPNVNNIKIFIADPNEPRKYMVLMPRKDKRDLKYGYYDMDKDVYIRDKNSWNCRSFHPNTNFYKSVNTPPRINNLRTGGSELVYQLVAKFETGGDDLRGGNDNVDVLVKYTDGSTEQFRNVNKGQRWPEGSINNVVLTLRKKVISKQITCLRVSTNFGGGMGGDNWNLDKISLSAYKENGESEQLQSMSGSPWVRFTGDNKQKWICTKHTNANTDIR